MQKISVVIIAKNETANIERCLKSVQWADEIVVVDSGSTDGTLEICRKYGCRVIHSEWLGFGKFKQLAVNSAGNDWIFSIDADEEVTPDLMTRIKEKVENPGGCNGFRVKRKSFYLGKLINYSGWQRDYQLRLFNRRFGNFNDKTVHESVQLSGKIGKIEEYMLHYTYPTISSHLQKMDRYTTLGAEGVSAKGKRSSIFGAIIRALNKFIKMYLLQRGILDGKAGFLLSLNSAFGVYLKYVKLWELNRK